MSDDWHAMVNKFENYRQEVREGKKGKTAQFWIRYLDLMRLQHQIYTAIQTNDFDIRLNAWKEMLPLYFALNKTNYARYGTWYVQTMTEVDDCYPSLRELLNPLVFQSKHKLHIPFALQSTNEVSNLLIKMLNHLKWFLIPIFAFWFIIILTGLPLNRSARI